jgi:hypothetical protein
MHGVDKVIVAGLVLSLAHVLYSKTEAWANNMSAAARHSRRVWLNCDSCCRPVCFWMLAREAAQEAMRGAVLEASAGGSAQISAQCHCSSRWSMLRAAMAAAQELFASRHISEWQAHFARSPPSCTDTQLLHCPQQCPPPLAL